MTHLAWTILILILFDAFLQIIGRHLNRASLERPLPQRFSKVYDSREYRRHQHYAAERMNLAQLEEISGLILLVGFWLAGGFAWLDGWAQGVTAHPVLAGLLFFGILALAKAILDLPFTIYRTFGIEARYGFNRTTPGTFILDLLKGLLLSVILGALLGGCLLWILNNFGPQYWWLCWLLWIGFSLILQYVAPRWIMPWFNTFDLLEDGELKQRIETYARTINFPLKQISVMDGSRRSAKSNAFFTGYGRHRRIVIFDTLIDKHPLSELLAILAHEMGHFKLHHIIKGMFLNYGISGLFLFGLALAMTWQPLLLSFGLTPSVHGGLLAAAILFTPLNRILSIALNGYSRKNEYSADRFSAETTGNPQAMVKALIRLSQDNYSHLTPHPYWVWLTYSHPPVLDRIQALSQQVQREALSSFSTVDSSH